MSGSSKRLSPRRGVTRGNVKAVITVEDLNPGITIMGVPETTGVNLESSPRMEHFLKPGSSRSGSPRKHSGSPNKQSH